MKDKAVIGLHSNSQCTETQYLASSYKEECWNEFLSLEPNLESLVASDTAKHRQTYQGRQKEEKVRCEDFDCDFMFFFPFLQTSGEMDWLLALIEGLPATSLTTQVICV